MTNFLTTVDFLSILPETIVFVMGMVVIVFDLFGQGRNTRNLAYLTLLTLAVAAYADFTLLGQGSADEIENPVAS